MSATSPNKEQPKRRRTIKTESPTVATEESRRIITASSSSTSTTAGSATSTSLKDVKGKAGNLISRDNIIKDKPKDPKMALRWEEDEVSKRTINEDQNVHKKACDELRKAITEIHALKSAARLETDTSVNAKVSESIENMRIHGSLQFVVLKKLNRLSHLRCKKVRDSTNEAKQKIDQYHLQLQNLLYEAMHLDKEINKCLEFRSKDEEIDLVSVDEFYKEAPEEISKPDKTKADDHLQTIARLDWELEQRKRLDAKLKETSGMKAVITKEIKSKQEILDSLQPKLQSILESTKATQEYLGMPFDEMREQYRTAQYLPTPLYVLYMQVTGYKDAYNKDITVSIEGDVEDAKIQANVVPDLEDDSDVSDQEGEENQRKRKRRRKTVENRMAEKRTKMLSRHPLSVVFKIQTNDSSLVLTFSYLTLLKIVTVKPQITVSSDVNNSIAGGDLLSADTLLDCLYPGDHGSTTPNPANKFQLSKLGMDNNIKSYIEQIGYPYIWVQWIAGLQFVDGSGAETHAQKDISASHMDDIIKKLRKRILTRLALQKQIAALEKGNVSVSKEHQKLFPVKISSRVISWKRSTYEDYILLPYTKSIVEAKLVHEADMIFEASIERGSARLDAQIVLSPDYPNQTPIIALNLNWKNSRNNTNDENIRMIEAELNVYCQELTGAKTADELLTNQIQRLLMCVDVYLEAESGGSLMDGPVEFPREKILPRIARGPDRLKPYCFISQFGFFAQR
ncbi:THO complex subunit 5 homolog A-like [Tubulanus polymorphus]|uniref:THO complex subunit 5 homolog A-like n=1 Tax=Tubulanus polymorphus TaxID=672921 RepID=UPI003DA29233